MRHWQDDRGFTLVETLVALIVFCILAATLQLGLSAIWRNARIADGQERALAQAKRLLAEAGVSRPLMPGTQTGSIDSMHWRTSVVPVAQPVALAASFDRLDGPAALAVDVRVTWSDATTQERSVSLRTIKIVRTMP